MQIIPEVLPHDRVRLATASAAFACVAAAGIGARTMGDTLFLNAYPPALLSSMYLVTAIVIALLAYFYPLAASRMPLGTLIPTVAVTAAVVGVLLRFSLAVPWKPLRVAAYVYGDLMCRIPMVLFWSFAALTFNPRESKRYLGMIGAAGTVASIVAGAAVVRVSKIWGPENLLWIVVLLVAGFALVIHRAARSSPERYLSRSDDARAPARIAPRYYAELLEHRQVYDVALLVLIGSFSLVLNDFTFKSAARSLYEGAALGSFFGTFYTGTSIAALIIQLFILRSLLARGGVSLALLAVPAALLVTSTGVALTGSFPWIVAAKAAEMVLEFTVNVAAVQMLFLAVRKQSRSQVRSFADGIAKPAGIAIAGVLIAVIARSAAVPLRVTALGVVAASIVWLWIARRNYADYIGGLVDLIGARRLDLGGDELQIAGTPVENHVREMLRTAPDAEIPYLLSIIAEVPDTRWDEEYRALLERNSATVKVATLQHLAGEIERGGTASPHLLEGVARELDHAVGEVRRWALRAALRLDRPAFTRRAREALTDPDHDVRSVAIAELLDSGDAGDDVRRSLEALIASEDPRSRAAAASAIENVGGGDFAPDLLKLLLDGDLEVRRAALRASGKRREAGLLPEIVKMLGDPNVGGAAAAAAAEYGSSSLQHLHCLSDRDSVPASLAAFRVPSIAVKIGQEALPLLEKALSVADVRLRVEVVAAYCRIARTLPLDGIRATLHDVVKRESKAALDLAGFRPAAASLAESEVLLRAIDEAADSHRENIFAALEVLHPSVSMHSIKHRLVQGTGDSRSEAIELLDNVLEKATIKHVLPLFEPPRQRPTSGPPRHLEMIIEATEAEWVTIGGVFAVGKSSVDGSGTMLAQAADHDLPEVRETALHVMKRSAEGESGNG